MTTIESHESRCSDCGVEYSFFFGQQWHLDDCPRMLPDGVQVLSLDRIEDLHQAIGEAVGELPTPCEHEYYRSRYCGVKICYSCNEHEGLARCYCGWSASGGDGRQELLEMGEEI